MTRQWWTATPSEGGAGAYRFIRSGLRNAKAVTGYPGGQARGSG